MLNSFRIVLISLWLPEVNTESMCAITACTSAEQFFGMYSKMGWKYPQ